MTLVEPSPAFLTGHYRSNSVVAMPRKTESTNYRDGVLDIDSTVSVTLASKKSTLAEILSLVPGSMLTFDVHCDHPLTLEASRTPIAIGETVKIGDKFGLRIRKVLANSDPS